MRGNKKAHTKILLNRENVLAPYLSPRQAEIYAEDEYKYLIHLLKLFPTDEFKITQYLLLKFHPIILIICKKYYMKKINLDWLDLISFARYSFIELVLRFNLNSTLYFKVFIPLALDRAINDFLLYDMRRIRLRNALRMDKMTTEDRDSILEEHQIVTNKENKDLEISSGKIDEYRTECVEFVKSHSGFTPMEKHIFLENYIRNKPLIQICKSRNFAVEKVAPRMQEILEELRDHIRINFL